jgi:hypothetical protein
MPLSHGDNVSGFFFSFISEEGSVQKQSAFYYHPTKRKRGTYQGQPECTVQVENIGMIFRRLLPLYAYN